MHEKLTAPAAQQASGNPPLRVQEVAIALRVDRATVYREIAAGRLDSYRVGSGRGTIRIPRSSFTQYLADRGIPTSELAVAL
ncbi:helix-turn-helix domain-containing protein [Streptomyces sp. NPDC058947]|uniref:helix-turn-helix domain-containing protein n=1 Tax=Streptomyces sp. NPDC058947 TaxID=3346675 RepID=UPI0036D12994